MTWCARLLLCCLLFAGCRAAVPPDAAPANPPSESAAEAPPDTPTPADASGDSGERAPGGVAFYFFNFTEQVANAAGVVVRGALIGLYFLFFPLIGFGPGGPG